MEAESMWETYIDFLNSFYPIIKGLTRKRGGIKEKLGRHNMPDLFNNNNNDDDNIYIYIYIYIYSNGV